MGCILFDGGYLLLKHFKLCFRILLRHQRRIFLQRLSDWATWLAGGTMKLLRLGKVHRPI